MNSGAIATEMLEVFETKTNPILSGHALPGICPLQRVGMPNEAAQLIDFLLSEKASYITGSVHMVDGGLMA